MRLRLALEAVCPIAMVSVAEDEASATYEPDPSATPTEISDADAVLAAFDFSQTAHNTWGVDVAQRAEMPFAADYNAQTDRDIMIREAIIEIKQTLATHGVRLEFLRGKAYAHASTFGPNPTTVYPFAPDVYNFPGTDTIPITAPLGTRVGTAGARWKASRR